MATKAAPFTTPVGRFVWGSMYKPRTTDAEGKPLVSKSGPNVGQPREDFAFGVAIPKGPETHWSQTVWGGLIWQVGHAGFPQGQASSPAFAWKVTDGDSPVPNRKGKKPCEREGYPGHWVLSFSSSYPPRIYNSDGSAAIAEPDAVKCGYYVQVAGNVDGNNSPNQPGVYLNHSMVALSGFGPEIIMGPDASSAGFGQSPLPPGASATPVGGMAAGAPPVPQAPPPVVQGYVPPVPTAAAVATPPPPHYPILGAGAPPAPAAVAPPPPVPVPVPAGPVMLPAAGGVPYASYIAQGWTDALLRSNGLMA